MPRVVSFIVLVAIILLIGMKFFQVMVLFIVPLFLAAVMVVIFKPLHLWITKKVGPRRRLAALLTTAAIILIVLVPTVGLTVQAISEGAELLTLVGKQQGIQRPQAEQDGQQVKVPVEQAKPADKNSLREFIASLVAQGNELLVWLHIPYRMTTEEVYQTVIDSLTRMAAPLAVGGLRVVGSALVSLAIMVLTIYYFFADGPAMIEALMRLSPLDDAYERELLDKFSDISRSVVMATLISAIAQGLLAGLGFFLAGIERVFFLIGMTTFLAMIPFVGAAAVWVPVVGWLHFHDQRTTAAVVLTVYCVTVVSMVDNVIKPYILHGQANLHPLLALLSVIGGVQVLGPIGILVGPMLVAFLQALMNMLNKELREMGEDVRNVTETVAAELAQPAAKPLTHSPKRKKKK